MLAKPFIALDGNGRLTGARTAQTAPYDRYTCHLCGSVLNYYPEYDTHRPWFEHATPTLTENGLRHILIIRSRKCNLVRLAAIASYRGFSTPMYTG